MTILDELFVNSIADNSANLHCTGIQRYLLLVNRDVRAILGPERYDIAFWLGLDSDDYENNDLNPSTTTSKLASNDSHTLNTSLESGSEESIDALRQEYEMLEHILIMDSLLRHFFEYWPEHPDPEELNTNVLMASVGPDRFEGHEVDDAIASAGLTLGLDMLYKIIAEKDQSEGEPHAHLSMHLHFRVAGVTRKHSDIYERVMVSEHVLETSGLCLCESTSRMEAVKAKTVAIA